MACFGMRNATSFANGEMFAYRVRGFRLSGEGAHQEKIKIQPR
jgi:hypothetical protein